MSEDAWFLHANIIKCFSTLTQIKSYLKLDELCITWFKIVKWFAMPIIVLHPFLVYSCSIDIDYLNSIFGNTWDFCARISTLWFYCTSSSVHIYLAIATEQSHQRTQFPLKHHQLPEAKIRIEFIVFSLQEKKFTT